MFPWFRPHRAAQRQDVGRQADQHEQPPRQIVDDQYQENPLHTFGRSSQRSDTLDKQPPPQEQSSPGQKPPLDQPVLHSVGQGAVNPALPNYKRPVTEDKPEIPNKPGLPKKSPSDPTDDQDVEFLLGIGREAKVWTTYVEETKAFDDDMVDGWNRSLDVTLVFAALFSAILTAFVLESAKQLEPDKADQTIAILREISRGLQTNGGQSPASDQHDDIISADFKPTTSAVWVNCLWFLSLSLSIAVSLAAMLAKQWCYYYVSSRNGDTITQAAERQKRYAGLKSWRMRGILEQLPMLMHIALALFSVGLVLYLWNINIAVATTVSAVSLTALILYLATILVPLWDVSCPYKTTQSVYIRIMLVALAKLIRSAFDRILLRLSQLRSSSVAPQSNHHESGVHTSSYAINMHLEPPTSPKSDDSDTSSVASHVETEPFVKDALKWLIGNSQKSNSIDTAIGALAIGKVHVEAADFKKQINLHLMKHFSDCFTSGKDRARLQPSHRHNAMQSAWNYVNWMSYFAGGNSEGITSQLLDFIQDDTLGVELVIRLGLALASLAEQTNLPPEAGKNVAFWLSAFVRWYDEEKIYLTEEMLSTLIEGITLVSCHVHLDTAPERIHVLAGPHLINILWKVSHMNGSKLRSSIGVNLAVVALTTNGLAYHILDKQRAVSAAHYLAFDFRSTEDRNESFISLVLFALLGFIHPRSELALDQHTVDTASRIIRETQYLERQNVPMRIPRLVDLDPLRRYLTSMLIEAMTRTSDNETLIATAFIHVGEWNAHAVFPSIIYAVCSLITAHLEKKTTLYQDTLRSATDLLFREVQNLRRLDTAIIGFESHNVAPNDLSGSQDIQSVEDDPQNDGQPVQKEQIASSTLALIMERSNDKHCLETAVCAILTHTQKCDADLVMKAASWFEKKFSSIDHDENPDETRLLHMCGYVRILTSMALHCTDSDKLAADLCISNLQLYKSIEKKINILTTKSKDIYICAFGLGGLAVWSFAGPNTICEATDTQDILGNAWDMVIEQAKHSVRPEAIEPSSLDDPLKHDLFSEAVEVLVNTTALLAAVTNPLRTITPLQSQGLLRLLAQYRSTVEGPVRLALAVALAFWGLSLDKWDFWCPEMRQKCWREWTQSKTRNRDAAALFLLGLSRFLAHYSDLKLDHASIRTIAFEIDRYMQKHASQPDTLTLAFLSGFDVRRHVRESVWQYLQKTESHGPFTRSAAACREKLKSAVQYDGGEGFVYEEPQPFARRPRDSLSGTGGGKEDPAMSKIREREASEISEQGAATALLG